MLGNCIEFLLRLLNLEDTSHSANKLGQEIKVAWEFYAPTNMILFQPCKPFQTM
jgi:hypothetical protein